MGLKLNPQTPSELVTKQLKEMGLELEKTYTVHWSDNFPGEWELRLNKKAVISLDCRKVEKLIQAKILVRSF